MASLRDASIELQAKKHPLVYSDHFKCIEDYILHLIHLRDYEEVSLLSRGKTVLDLGCNNGYGTNLLSTVATSVIGVDVSEAALSDARSRFPNLDFRIVDGLSLPFESAYFDVVVSFQVIEHIFDVKNYLTEISRVLKATGKAIFSTPNAAIRLDAGMSPWNPFHVREYRAVELKDVLSQCFAQVKVKGLFASELAYKIEYTRCQNALKSARLFGKRRSTKQVVKQKLKKIIPDMTIRKLRQLQSKSRIKMINENPDAEFVKQLSTSHFFYREEDLDLALDLMAICKKI